MKHTSCALPNHHQSSIQFWSGFIPVNGGGRIYPTLSAIFLTPTLHLARFMASFFSKPTLLLSFSTCVFFGRPRFLLPFTSNSNAFHRTCPSSLLNTCPYHLTPFALPSEPLFPSIPTSPSGALSSFSPSALHHTLLTQSFSKLPSHFPSDTMSHSHITSPLLHDSNKPFLSPSARTFF